MTKNILFVTADLAVHTGEMYAAGKSGGCGLPVATQWRVRDSRPATPAELAEHTDLIAALSADVAERRYWFAPDGVRALPGAWEPRWAIRGTDRVHARIGWLATGQRDWGRTACEFAGVAP